MCLIFFYSAVRRAASSAHTALLRHSMSSVIIKQLFFKCYVATFLIKITNVAETVVRVCEQKPVLAVSCCSADDFFLYSSLILNKKAALCVRN